MPIAFVDSWTTAIERVRTELSTAATAEHATRFGAALQAEKNFVLDYLPPRLNVVALFSGGGDTVQQSWDESPPKSIVMNARLEARLRTRADARAMSMLFLKHFPVYHKGNVEWFRIAGDPDIQPETTRLANDKKDQLYWKMVLPCLLVFRTSEEFS